MEYLATRITEVVILYSVLFFGLVLLLMVLNENRRPRPPLDRAFIWEKFALFLVVAWSTVVILGLSDNAIRPFVRVVIWTNLGCAETAVLYYIYVERFGVGTFKRAGLYVYHGCTGCRDWLTRAVRRLLGLPPR